MPDVFPVLKPDVFPVLKKDHDEARAMLAQLKEGPRASTRDAVHFQPAGR
jgi:hypothetical protein